MADGHEWASWDGVETAARIGSGDVRAIEVLEAAIERAQAARHLGAIVTDTFERARRELGSREGPLRGVPTLIKDLAQVRGVPTGWGMAGSAFVSRRSDPFVERFEATGVASIGKSATPELGLTATTEPVGRAPCRNPWDLARSAGGSSGGAAAMVAAGVVPLAHASDGGGSIRIPAACCGLVGLKVSRGRLDMEGSNLLPVNVAVHGCVTRTVRDTIAFWSALETARVRRRMAPIGSVTAGSQEPLRVGVFVAAPLGTSVHPEAQAAARAAGLLVETLGHRVEEISCPFDGSVTEDFLRYWGFIAWLQKSTGKVLMHRGFQPSKLDAWSLGLSRYFTEHRADGLRAIRRLRRVASEYATVMSRYDVLVCPTLATPPPLLGHIAPELALAIETVQPWPRLAPLAGAPV